MRRSRRLQALVAVGLILAVGITTAMIVPAIVQAESTSTSCQGIAGKWYTAPPSWGWANQCQMVNDPNVTGYGLDRETFVLDPGVGSFLTRDQLIANAANYEKFGFSDQFLWYA